MKPSQSFCLKTLLQNVRRVCQKTPSSATIYTCTRKHLTSTHASPAARGLAGCYAFGCFGRTWKDYGVIRTHRTCFPPPQNPHPTSRFQRMETLKEILALWAISFEKGCPKRSACPRNDTSTMMVKPIQTSDHAPLFGLFST